MWPWVWQRAFDKIQQSFMIKRPTKVSIEETYTEKTLIEKYTCTSMFIAALFTIAKTWKQCKCPSTEEWIKKMWYNGILYIVLWYNTMEYYSAIKKNKIFPFVAI